MNIIRKNSGIDSHINLIFAGAGLFNLMDGAVKCQFVPGISIDNLSFGRRLPVIKKRMPNAAEANNHPEITKNGGIVCMGFE